MGSFAQEADPTLKHSVATNSFWSNWFIQVGVDWNAWYSGQEHGLGLDRSPFKKFRSNPGASIAIGKWFTPGRNTFRRRNEAPGNCNRSCKAT